VPRPNGPSASQGDQEYIPYLTPDPAIASARIVSVGGEVAVHTQGCGEHRGVVRQISKPGVQLPASPTIVYRPTTNGNHLTWIQQTGKTLATRRE
jgi:hypothetical protein